MGRNSASLRVLAAEVGRVQDRLQRSQERSQDDARKDRKVVPWKEMEQKRAAKAAPPWKQELSYEDHPADDDPTSGIRGPGDTALSYTVYSVNDLDARSRTSVPPPMPAKLPSRWPDVWRSAQAVVRAWWTYYVNAKPRPQVMDVCRVPLMTLRADLGVALRQLPWKKIGIRAAMGFGAILVFGFIVFTVAELTDDLKPRTTNRLAVEEPKPAETAAAPPESAPAQSNANEKLNEKPIELDEAPAVAKAKPVAKPKPAAKPNKKKKGTEIFNP